MQSHRQTSFKAGITRRSLICGSTAALLHPIGRALSSYSAAEQTALDGALQNTGAIAIILHQESGRVLASHGNADSVDSPGSILKPLLLFAALQRKLIASTETVFCRRDLHIRNQSYPCTHPQSNISFAAQEALAYSCNTWFASLALRFSPSGLTETLGNFHLHSDITPSSPEQTQLVALGLAGVKTSPFQIATAYRVLSTQLRQPVGKPVADGLHDSVSFGMARNADTPGVYISGKTGTASNPPRQLWSHGWFAGFATLNRIPLVISLYLPHGNGADAAHLARNFFLLYNKTNT